MKLLEKLCKDILAEPHGPNCWADLMFELEEYIGSRMNMVEWNEFWTHLTYLKMERAKIKFEFPLHSEHRQEEWDNKIKEILMAALDRLPGTNTKIDYKPRPTKASRPFSELQPLDIFWWEGSVYIKIWSNIAYREENEKLDIMPLDRVVQPFDAKITIEEL